MRRLLVALAVIVSLALSACAGSVATPISSRGPQSARPPVGSSRPTPSPTPGTIRILFIGNSYTYVNDLPRTFATLARSRGRDARVDMLATGGATLQDHADDPATIAKLDETRWDYVVLQEQSEIPSVTSAAESAMFPPARGLVDRIRRRGEKPLFFVTWGHRDGDPSFHMPDYETMQKAIDGSYLSIGQELDVPVVPVGVAWFTVQRQDQNVQLWDDDGSHPALAGTYLAACVFYAAIYRESPEGSPFDGGLGADTAGVLQRAAAGTVLENPAQWGLH